MDALFAQPTQPASSPRVRTFAELALNEIRSGMDGDASLLADKQVFSEFMDRVNESVLLGRREPPSSASVLRDCSQESVEACADPPAPDKGVSMGSPASSLQSFTVNGSSNSGPSAAVAATHLDALSSKLAFSPKRYRRQRNDNADLGPPGQPQQSPQSRAKSQRVRFDVCDEGEGMFVGTEDRPREPPQYRVHADDFAQEDRESVVREQAEYVDIDDEPPRPSGDIAGSSLLQELRRWRIEATEEIINTDLNRPSVSPSSKPSVSGRPSPHSSWDSLPPPSSPLHDMPPPYSPAVHRGDSVAASMKGTLTDSVRVNQTTALAESQDFRATGGGGWRVSGDAEHNRVTRSGAGGETFRGAEEHNELNVRGTARRVANGTAPLAALSGASDWQLVGNGLVGGAGVGSSAGRRWGGVGSKGHGEGLPKGRREGPGEDAKPVGEGDQEKDDTAELSLDLSDCSDEKLGAVLQRGRRLGSSRAG